MNNDLDFIINKSKQTLFKKILVPLLGLVSMSLFVVTDIFVLCSKNKNIFSLIGLICCSICAIINACQITYIIVQHKKEKKERI
jgi:hypothetical protein